MTWVLLAVLGLTLSIAGVQVAAVGVRRSQAGERLAQAVARLEYQMRFTAVHTLARADYAYRVTRAGRRLADRGRHLSFLGFVVCVIAILGTFVDTTS